VQEEGGQPSPTLARLRTTLGPAARRDTSAILRRHRSGRAAPRTPRRTDSAHPSSAGGRPHPGRRRIVHLP
jgi:hypothetical protein